MSEWRRRVKNWTETATCPYNVPHNFSAAQTCLDIFVPKPRRSVAKTALIVRDKPKKCLISRIPNDWQNPETYSWSQSVEWPVLSSRRRRSFFPKKSVTLSFQSYPPISVPPPQIGQISLFLRYHRSHCRPKWVSLLPSSFSQSSSYFTLSLPFHERRRRTHSPFPSSQPPLHWLLSLGGGGGGNINWRRRMTHFSVIVGFFFALKCFLLCIRRIVA